jgi:hypothetical protein
VRTELLIRPRDDAVDARHKRFDDVNAYISAHGGWVVSIPGARDIAFQALPGSSLPDALRKLGWRVERTGESQRILARAVSQKFELSSSGAFVPFVDGSSKPVSLITTGAGLAIVEVFDLRGR